MKIISARYANSQNTAISMTTADCGVVMAFPGHPLWDEAVRWPGRIAEFEAPSAGVRTRRRQAFREELGRRGDNDDELGVHGDLIDAIMKQIQAWSAESDGALPLLPEVKAILDKIQEIKARHPPR